MKCPTCGQKYPEIGKADPETILVEQLKMIACRSTFDSLEQVQTFADQCLKY